MLSTAIRPARGAEILATGLLACLSMGCAGAAAHSHSGSGGTGNGPDGGTGGLADGGGGQAGSGSGCLDLVVSMAQGLPDAEGGGEALNGGVWRTPTGLHVGWKAYHSETAGSYRPWLFVATFDPATGNRLTLRRYDVLPASATSNNSNIRGIAGSESEEFAASVRTFGQSQTLFLGHLDDVSSRQMIDLGLDYDSYDIPDIGWDGEAFAVQARRTATGDLFVLRVAPTGQVVLASTKYGATPSPGGTTLGHRVSTNPISGATYLLDAASLARLLSGHDRSGQSVSWAATGPFDIRVPGQDFDAPTNSPGVAADNDGGAWATWSQAQATGNYAAIAAHVTKVGAVDQSLVIAQQGGFRAPAIVAVSSSRVWVAQTDAFTVTAYESEGSAPATKRTLVKSAYVPTSGDSWDTRNFHAFDWQGERWLSFSEPGGLLHIVKVLGDCTYQAAAKPAAN